MKQRLRFGDAVSLRTVAMRGAVGGTSTFVVPAFGTTCVCCNAEAHGRMQDFDPSTDRRRADPVPMPVCAVCKDHALISTFASTMQVLGVLVGIALTALGVMYAVDRPGDAFLKWMIVAGAALVVASFAWGRSTSARQKRAHKDGHHPGLSLSIATGATLLDSENETLVEDLLARNPSAVRMPTPLFWRLRGEGMPKAKVIAKRD